MFHWFGDPSPRRVLRFDQRAFDSRESDDFSPCHCVAHTLRSCRRCPATLIARIFFLLHSRFSAPAATAADWQIIYSDHVYGGFKFEFHCDPFSIGLCLASAIICFAFSLSLFVRGVSSSRWRISLRCVAVVAAV